jgi:MoxR-like ATPase
VIKIKNIENGEMMQVWQTGIDKASGCIYCNGTPTAKYLAKYPLTATDEKIGEDTVLTLNDGWEIVKSKGERKQRQPKAKTDKQKAESQDETTKDEQPEAVEVVTEDEPKPETTGQTVDDTTNEQALIAALKNLRGGAVDIAKVREIVADELSKLVAKDAKKAAKVIEAAKKNKGKKNEVYCAKFQRIVAKVSRGNNVYLYGPAGSGKSHTAEQVAEALGLDFYGQTTIQFAHDVRGYGDAGGKFQDTPFYKAFAFGGLYFQDEYDRSNAEAAIVLNSALANGWYDFPIVGRVEAHPNFRFMAAGNTLMTGADEEYVTGQEIDASSRDRFAFFFEIDYSHEVELRIAHGNEKNVSFVEDVRQAVKQTGIKHVVSYRATSAMIDEVENENDLVACCDESIFKALDVDARREIYERLNDKANIWAKALKKLI